MGPLLSTALWIRAARHDPQGRSQGRARSLLWFPDDAMLPHRIDAQLAAARDRPPRPQGGGLACQGGGGVVGVREGGGLRSHTATDIPPARAEKVRQNWAPTSVPDDFFIF